MSVEFDDTDLYMALFSCVEIANYYNYLSDEQFDELLNYLRAHYDDIIRWQGENTNGD